jgi:predicted PurR-regulated permease PerM
MKPLNIVVGFALLAFAFYGLIKRREVYERIKNEGKVPMYSVEERLLGECKNKIDRYGYVKYLVAQVIWLILGLLLLYGGVR